MRSVPRPPLSRRDSRGETALFKAAKQGHTACVAVLLAAGADRDAARLHGYTDVTCTFLVQMVNSDVQARSMSSSLGIR